MLEKLKELLGEELANQVTEKLGDTELAIMNDGSVVKADKHDSLKAEYKALESKYTTDISEINSKLTEATSNAADYDTLKGTLETFKLESETRQKEHDTQLLSVKMDKDIDSLLYKNNVKDKYMDIAKQQFNKESLKYDNETLLGAGDTLGRLTDTFPEWFGEIKKAGPTPQGGVQTPTPDSYKARLEAATSMRDKIKIKQEAKENGEII